MSRVLLIVTGGIAAYKSLELVRLLRKRDIAVRCVLTRSGKQFVTKLSLQALSEDRVYTDLFSLTDESEMGHIQLSRSADLIVVAPASANMLAAMAGGHANDLATTLLLATDKAVLVAPAMNVRMWLHPATVANIATLRERGVHVVGPDEGAMACNEFGPGRLSEPGAILDAIAALLGPPPTPPEMGGGKMIAAPPPISGGGRGEGGPLAGRHAIVTSGPTHEPIDPVRYLANRSSGRQGHAIAAALAVLGARVTLVRGPVNIPDPAGVATTGVETAAQMMDAVLAALPADVLVSAAAVADWRVDWSASKLKKDFAAPPPSLALVQNPDILASVAGLPSGERPRLVVGFAAETDDVLPHAAEKRVRKQADWIVANDVSPATGIMGGADNAVSLVTKAGVETWPRMSKWDVATRLAARIADALA